MTDEQREPLQQWTAKAKRRVTLVVSIVKGKPSVAKTARAHGLTIGEVGNGGSGFG